MKGALPVLTAPVARPALTLTRALAWPWLLLGLAIVLARAAPGQQAGAMQGDTFAVLLKWLPLVLSGFLFNLLVGVLAMALGTAAGLPLGLTQLATYRPVRASGWLLIQFLRNVPWLVLRLRHVLAAVRGARPRPHLSGAGLGQGGGGARPSGRGQRRGNRSRRAPVHSRGAVGERESLAFSRRQVLLMVILPQAFRRMLPPWMNLYAIVVMATTLISVVGIQDGLTAVRAAVAAEARPNLMMPFYLLLLALFFAHTYPIARLTRALERQ